MKFKQLLSLLIIGKKTNTKNNADIIPTTRIGFFNIPFLRRWIAFQQTKWFFLKSLFNRHAFIVGRTGSGKSCLLFHILLLIKMKWGIFQWSSKVKNDAAFIMIDPHGELSTQCARQKLFFKDLRRMKKSRKKKKWETSNLVYLSPTLGQRFGKLSTFCINPFDLQKKKMTWDEISIHAQHLTIGFTSMLSKGEVQLTANMKTLLYSMVTVLLTMSLREGKRNMTFFDLLRFLDNRTNKDLLEFGANQLNHDGHNLLFRNDFNAPQYNQTKFFLRTKLYRLLCSKWFVLLMCQPNSTVNFRKFIAQGKTVLINISKTDLGDDVSEIMGRSIVAMIQSVIKIRANWRNQFLKKVPTFLVLDEAATFSNENMKEIFDQYRKFKLNLLMVNQYIGQGGLSKDFQQSMMNNTSLKITGASDFSTKNEMAQEFETDKKNLTKLPVGTFSVKAGERAPFRVKFPKYFLPEKTMVNDARWNEVQKEMLRLYYRSPTHYIKRFQPQKSSTATVLDISSPEPFRTEVQMKT